MSDWPSDPAVASLRRLLEESSVVFAGLAANLGSLRHEEDELPNLLPGFRLTHVGPDEYLAEAQ